MLVNDVLALDFMNDVDTIEAAFSDYYRTTILAETVIQGEMPPLSARPRRHFPWSDLLTNREDLDMSSEITSSNTMRQDSIANPATKNAGRRPDDCLDRCETAECRVCKSSARKTPGLSLISCALDRPLQGRIFPVAWIRSRRL
jgi:hypothetical protein